MAVVVMAYWTVRNNFCRNYSHRIIEYQVGRYLRVRVVQMLLANHSLDKMAQYHAHLNPVSNFGKSTISLESLFQQLIVLMKSFPS